ncbi:MAG TPA: hypothetical protein VMT32_16790 [Bryobacteraceae bacterium]|nr:hypothetical protein [Bryobacteraceae bacterium]
MNRPRSSQQRYLAFVRDYKHRRLDEATEARENQQQHQDRAEAAAELTGTRSRSKNRGKRRVYLCEYLGWLWPHRYAVGGLFVLALIGAGLQMVEPLFMRFIVDRVLLNTGSAPAVRFIRLNLAGALFLALAFRSNLAGALRDYRQRLLSARLMLTLRRSLFERLLHLPLPKLWA